MIGIIDYGMGNLGSVTNACRFLEVPAKVITRPEESSECDALILPGVGAFGDCMEHLSKTGFVPMILDWVAKDRPLLGICLGLQVLFSGSEESPGVPGLGILPGRVKKFPERRGFKVPQIGWNMVQWKKPSPVFSGLPDGTFFYFVHSFYVECDDPSVVAGETEYGLQYVSAISRGNLSAVQFHPEKSQKDGLRLIENFARLVSARAGGGVAK